MNVICWSGGKDSTATVILAYLNKIHIDIIIMSEVMFDKSKGISNEDEEHMNFVRTVAIPQFKAWGYDTEILHDKADYLSLFYKKITKSKTLTRNGLYRAFPLGQHCVLNDPCKMRPIKQFLKEHKNAVEYVGIAIDETERLQALKERGANKISLLEQFGYTEKMAFELCKQYGLLSPIYFKGKTTRGGCWNCPNQSYESLARLKLEHSDKWEALRELSKTPNLCSYGFKYGETFASVEIKADLIIKGWELQERQISIEQWQAILAGAAVGK